jgi:hypothetical protein
MSEAASMEEFWIGLVRIPVVNMDGTARNAEVRNVPG